MHASTDKHYYTIHPHSVTLALIGKILFLYKITPIPRISVDEKIFCESNDNDGNNCRMNLYCY